MAGFQTMKNEPHPRASERGASQASELEWQAFLYVAGELEGEALAQFEQQLDSDQLAREAVAAAVSMSDVLARAAAASAREPQVARAASAASLWQSRRFALASCASLLLAFGAVTVWILPSDGGSPSQSEARRLAMAWVGAWAGAEAPFLGVAEELGMTGLDVPAGGDDLAGGDDPAGELDEAERALSSANLDAEAELSIGFPSWMLAAVTSESEPEEGAQPSSGEPVAPVPLEN